MLNKILKSWSGQGDSVHTLDELLAWIEERNQNLVVNIVSNRLSESDFWLYDEQTGCIRNQNHSFFEISGMKCGDVEQPIILQNEIGYLGILAKEINGVLHFLMQAKIEPGNINKIQISPTIQATKSNFTQKHGGNKPAYLDYFVEADKHTIIVDQIQSEQSSRFYKKRNRNIVLLVEDDVEVLPSHKWLTLRQLKQLMHYDNLVNMDTRTVLSCLPLAMLDDERGKMRRYFTDQSLYNSMFDAAEPDDMAEIYNYINNYKMFDYAQSELVRLDELKNWQMDDFGIRCKEPYSFSVIYCDIEVEGREVRRWTQPLFKAEGIAMFGLFTAIINGKRRFLVKAQAEVGCFDGMELGPTVQRDAVCRESENEMDRLFMKQLKAGKGIRHDVILSEEGGRFYHEQNRNVILEIEPFEPPKGYLWADYKTLNLLTQVNNCLNIQLRNLLSLLEV